MGKGIISITPELLFDLLRLDNNFKYKNAQFNFIKQCFDIFIEHDKLPETEPEYILNPITIIYEIVDNKINISMCIYDDLHFNKKIEIANMDYVCYERERFNSVSECKEFLINIIDGKHSIELSNYESQRIIAFLDIFIKDTVMKYKLKKVLDKHYDNMPLNAYNDLLNLLHEKGDIDE